VVLAALYRFAPSRAAPRWRWVTWGAGIATLIWVLGSIAFSIYVRNFGNYDATYGSLGAVIILLMWLWLSAFVVLLGAEVNSEMEHQTERDSTTGAPEPRGRRGAQVADEVAESP
jgi:membrane protein